MIKFIIGLFVPSVDSITASLARTAAKLEAHSDRQHRRVVALEAEQGRLYLKEKAAVAQSLRALAVASKVKALLD